MVAAMAAVTAAVRRSRKGSGSREIRTLEDRNLVRRSPGSEGSGSRETRTLGDRNLEHRSRSWEGLGWPIYTPRHTRQQPAKGSAGKLSSGP